MPKWCICFSEPILESLESFRLMFFHHHPKQSDFWSDINFTGRKNSHQTLQHTEICCGPLMQEPPCSCKFPRVCTWDTCSLYMANCWCNCCVSPFFPLPSTLWVQMLTDYWGFKCPAGQVFLKHLSHHKVSTNLSTIMLPDTRHSCWSWNM